MARLPMPSMMPAEIAERLSDQYVPDQPAIAEDQLERVIAAEVREKPYTAEEIFCAERDSETQRIFARRLEADVRLALANALETPTPANHEALGIACKRLAVRAMEEPISDLIRREGWQ